MSDDAKSQSRYHQLIEKIFFDGHRKGITEIPFERTALKEAATSLKMALPANLGDVKTTIVHPPTTSHGRLTEEQRLGHRSKLTP